MTGDPELFSCPGTFSKTLFRPTIFPLLLQDAPPRSPHTCSSTCSRRPGPSHSCQSGLPLESATIIRQRYLDFIDGGLTPPTGREPVLDHGRLLECQLWHVFHVGRQRRCVVALQSWPQSPGTCYLATPRHRPRPLTGRIPWPAAFWARCRLQPAVSLAAVPIIRPPPPLAKPYCPRHLSSQPVRCTSGSPKPMAAPAQYARRTVLSADHLQCSWDGARVYVQTLCAQIFPSSFFRHEYKYKLRHA